MQDKLLTLYNGEMAFDEKTFARKIVKIYRTLKKMEYSKDMGPFFSESFCELSDLLL